MPNKAYEPTPEAREKRAAYIRAYNLKNREKIKIKHAAYHIANLETIKAKARINHAAHREEDNARCRSYRASHRDEQRIVQKAWRDAHKKERTANNRALLYDLSQDTFDALLKSQGGGCAICKSTKWTKKSPQIDHDHVTGKVRGILCHTCNLALGAAKDNLEIIQAMAEYLKKFK